MKTRIKMMMIVAMGVFGLQSCTHDDYITADAVSTNGADEASYASADAINGSVLYNDFTKETGSTSGFVPNDASVLPANITGYADFYRCKSCHAWDQKGRNGSYSNRGAVANRPDIAAIPLTTSKNYDISDLFKKIKNTGGATVDAARTANGLDASLGGNNHPDFGKILTDEKIWDLVKFLKEGTYDTDKLYDLAVTGYYPNATPVYNNLGRDGVAATGTAFYNTKCAGCHGTDGTKIMFGGTTSLGKFIRTKPYEIQHKIISGQLGSSMGHTEATVDDIKNMYKAMNDVALYQN